LIEYMASKVSSPQNMFDFMVTIALLIGSLTITQQMGVMGGAMGMQAVGKMKQLGIKALVGGLERATIGKKGKDGERTGGLWGLTKYGDSHLWAATGFSPLRTPKKFYQGLKDQAKRKKEERELKGDIKAGKHLKAGGVESLILGAGAGRDYAEAFAAGGFLNRKGFGRMLAMLKGGPVEWDKIEGEIKAERQKIALLKLEKEKGDPLKVYDNDLREKIEDNTRDKTDKEKERDNMPKVAERMRDEYKKAEREGKEEAPALKKEFEDFMAAAPAREKELNEEILDHNVEIQKASSLLDEDDETRRGKAEDKYKQEAKQKKDDAQNLKEGKLTEAEVKMKSGELNDLNDALIKIHRDLKDASDKKDHVLIGQLKEQEKKTTDKIQELKQVFATDKDGEFTKNKKGHYQLRDDYRITDEEQLESRGQEAKRLEQEAEVYERIATGKGRSDEKIDEAIKAASQTITDMRGGQAKYAAPQTFYADQARRQLVEEESKKITSENWHEQLAAIQDAMLSKDWAKFEANFKAAARNGNENEVMDQLGFVNEYRGEEELKEPGTGGGSDAFRKYYLMKNLGMDDESSKAMMDDVGYIGEGIGHWSMSRAHTLKGGRRVNQSWEDQQDEVYAEQSKVDGRRLFRTYNRLAWGGEVPQMDGTRRFQFSPYALRRWLTSYQSIYDGHIKNNEFSKSQAEHFVNPVAMAQLEATAKLLPTKKEQDQFRWVLEKLKRYAATLPKGKEKSFNTSNIIANVDFRHQF